MAKKRKGTGVVGRMARTVRTAAKRAAKVVGRMAKAIGGGSKKKTASVRKSTTKKTRSPSRARARTSR